MRYLFFLCLISSPLFCQKIDSIRAKKLDSLVMVHYNKGDYATSIQHAFELLDLKKAEKAHDTVLAKQMSNIALLYDYLGEYSSAEALHIEIKDIWEKFAGKQHPEYIKTINNLAASYLSTQNYDKALLLMEESLNLRKTVYGEFSGNYATGLNNLALLYKRIGKGEQAIPLYEKAALIWAKTEGKNSQYYATALTNMASIYRSLGEYQAAEKRYLESEAILVGKFGKSHPAFADINNNIALLYKDMKQYDIAENRFKQSISIYESSLGKLHPDYVNAVNNLANFYTFTESYDSSLFYCYHAIACNSRTPVEAFKSQLRNISSYNFSDKEKAQNSLAVLSKTFHKRYLKLSQKEDLQHYHETAEVAIAINEKIRNEFSTEASKLLVLNKNKNFIEMAISSSVELNSPKLMLESFSFADLNKSILLADASKSEKARTFGDLPDSLAAQEQALQKQLDKLKKAEIEAKSETEKSANVFALNDLNQKIGVFKKHLEQTYPKYYRLKYEQNTAKATDIQKMLGAESIFLEYFIADTFVYLYALTNNKFQLLPLKVSKTELTQKIKNLRKALSDYDFIKKEEDEAYQLYTETAYWFYKNLLAPALTGQKNITQLIVVTDGELGHLPFEAFLTKEIKENVDYNKLPYLLNDYHIGYHYSATLWQEQAQEKQAKGNGKILAMAASYKGAQDSLRTRANRAPHLRNLRDALQDLPAARIEVEALSKEFKGDFYFASDANEKNFKAKVEGYDIIHLATHGLLNTQYPILSSLALTEDGDSIEDNFLQAYEISHLKLNAKLVVLSACETGFGKFQQGEGVMSLARSFMYAGVPSLVVSLWQVNDASTSAIMQAFYKNLAKGMSKSEALRKAKLSYIQFATSHNANHPAFWAPFIIIGDDRPIYVSSSQTTNLHIWIIGAVILSAIAGGFFLLRRRKEK